MENSFFEYRDKTGVESDSDSEFIDNSIVNDSMAFKKTPGKNKTVFVPESESNTDDESEEEEQSRAVVQKLFLHKSSLVEPHVISSSDDDASKRGSIRRQSEMSFNKVVLSSSDEDEEVSPELVPKRRPPMRPKSSDSSDSSIIGRKKNKRMILLDSDTENSIVIEKERQKKQPCLKDTPLKIEGGHRKKVAVNKSLEESIMDESIDESYESEECDDNNDSKKDDTASSRNDISTKETHIHEQSDESSKRSDENDGSDVVDPTDEEEPDEDQMVYSRATRMSIMGIIAKDNDSDESDFIQSDEQSRASSVSAASSQSINPVTKDTIPQTPEKTNDNDNHSNDIHNDTTRLSCSPFMSPLHDRSNVDDEIVPETGSKAIAKDTDKIVSNVSNNVIRKFERKSNEKDKNEVIEINENWSVNNKERIEDEVTFISSNEEFKNSFCGKKVSYKERVIDDEITIIDNNPEVIALSSDDDEEKAPKKSPKPSPKASKEGGTSHHTKDKDGTKNGTLKSYLVPQSYPNQVMYVKRHVRENELNKLESLREDLYSVKHILDSMEIETLPDRGAKLMERLSALEREIRLQGDKVAAMVVEPEDPPAQVMSRDGYAGGSQAQRAEPTWEDIQKASNAVQPRMFGKQAMATHMAERNLILERLRDLHESLGSRPAESEESAAPSALRSALMPHQTHALAWLRWRETQRPPAGILADDMGLGKTITMIALIMKDKEDNISQDDSDDEPWNGKAANRLTQGGTLVVCPASLMQQWAAEVAKHCAPHAASVCLHHGANRAEHPHRLVTYDIVVTTYNILQRDNTKNGVLFKIQWRRIILDEAHIVRNHKSITSMAVSALKGRRRWCLTGTPVQNKDLDLFALLKFLRCTPFDDLNMWKKWIDNKSMGGEERLSTIMRCLLLRRTKAQLQAKGQLACLPSRVERLVEVTLTKDEMNVYQKVLVFSKTLFAQFLQQRAERHADGAPSAHKNAAYDKMHKKMIALQGAKPVKSHEILVLLLRLRQVCCHCGLIAAMLDGKDDEAGELNEDLASKDLLDELNKLSLEDGKKKRKSGQRHDPEDDDKENEPEEGTSVREAIRSVLSPNNPVFQLTRTSSKISQVMHCLQENVFNNKGDKAVVVSQWTAVLRLVEGELRQLGVRSVTLSGEVPVNARPPIIAKINDPNNDVKILLLSLCAGGVGLNLCGANHLLLLDPHWNPQLEQQAQDRVYRVGQTKPVRIYRFMCVDTVEQSIRKLQQAKLELAENVLTGARNNASKLSIEDLKVLFNM